MKHKSLFFLCFIFVFSSLVLLNNVGYAHSGGTDASGGHHDYANKSGLGAYHYHHGYPAHLHPNGVCPYSYEYIDDNNLSNTQSVSNSTIITKTAYASVKNVLVDDVSWSLQAYTIDGYTYYKIRDLAYILNGTSAFFNVTYDVTCDSLYIWPGYPYFVAGNELSIIQESGSASVKTSTSMVYINTPINEKPYIARNRQNITIYKTNNNNYFKLRDIGQALGIDVSYDETNGNIIIRTHMDIDKTA